MSTVAIKQAIENGEIPSAWDIKSFAQAVKIADALTTNHEETYLACDRGPWTSPRYCVIKAPKVGEPISYAFNGDSYPCGHIKTISKSYRLITSDKGERFYRRYYNGKPQDGWVKQGGTWGLVQGHVSKYNREV